MLIMAIVTMVPVALLSVMVMAAILGIGGDRRTGGCTDPVTNDGAIAATHRLTLGRTDRTTHGTTDRRRSGVTTPGATAPQAPGGTQKSQCCLSYQSPPFGCHVAQKSPQALAAICAANPCRSRSTTRREPGR